MSNAAVSDEQQQLDLGSYDRKKIARTVVKLTKAGDGLSKALAIAPQKLHVNEKGYALVEFEVEAHTHKRIAGVPNTLELIQILQAQTVTIMDADTAAPYIEAQRRAEQQHEHDREVAKRAAEREDEDTEAEVMRRQHMTGAHADGLRDGCEMCDKEREAAAAESGSE